MIASRLPQHPAIRAISDVPKRAHSLFPVDQAILWIPGFAGYETPYCSQNILEEAGHMQPWDDQQSSRTRFAVSPETYIAWHTDVSPAFPFHPVPILRELSDAEMLDLTRHVERLGDLPPDPRNPLFTLHAGRLGLIYRALAEMNIPATFIPRIL